MSERQMLQEIKEQMKQKDEQMKQMQEQQMKQKDEQIKEQMKQMKQMQEQIQELLLQFENLESGKKSKKLKFDPVGSCSLAPSSATWDLVTTAGLLPPFSDFLKGLEPTTWPLEEYEVSEEALCVMKTNAMILQTSRALNEGHAMQVCGNHVAYFTTMFNNTTGANSYSYDVFPVIYPVESNHRKDKKSDYVLVRMKNKRTIVVMELKLGMSSSITAADRDSLAQLFYEAYLVSQREKVNYTDLICIYADHTTSLFFLMDMSLVTKVCKVYINGSSLSLVQQYNVVKMLYEKFE